MILPKIRLDQVCLIRRGSTITKNQVKAGNIPVVAGGKTSTISHDEANRAANTITVSASGASAGFVNIWRVPIFASDCSTVEVINNSTDIDYVYYFLKFKQDYLYSLQAGAAQPHVYAKDIAKIEIPIPSLKEQRRIASILDKAHEIRQKRQQSIAKLDELLQAEFLNKFSNTNFKSVMVQNLLETEKSMRTGPFGSQLLHSEFVDEGITVLGIDNAVKNQFQWGKPRFITEQKYQALSRYTVKPNDVLITIMGTCGRCAVVPEDIPLAINTKHLCCITLDKTQCEPEFLHSYFLMHPTARHYLDSRVKGAIMDGLNMGIIKELPVELPPLAEQKAFTKFKKAIIAQKQRMEIDAEKIDELFGSLQQKAFNGTL